MYTTDRAEQALDDIRKVFLLYERGILLEDNVKSLTNRIVDLYVTKSVTADINGQSCRTCLYYCNGVCRRGKDAMIVNDSHFCDSWVSAIKADIRSNNNGQTKES